MLKRSARNTPAIAPLPGRARWAGMVLGALAALATTARPIAARESTSLDDALSHPGDVDVLDLTSKDLPSLPPTIKKLTHLRVLRLACNEMLQELPPETGALSNLEILDIDNGNGCAMKLRIPLAVSSLKKLRSLNLSGALSPASKFPFSGLENLTQLETLNLNHLPINVLPKGLFHLKNLRKLTVKHADLRELPPEFVRLTRLEKLDVSSNSIRTLPDLTSLSALQTVDLGDNGLTLDQQRALLKRFPSHAKIFFENEFDGPGGNERAK